MNGSRLLDALGAWILEALPGLFRRGLIALVVLVIGIQIGIHKGRLLEKEAINRDAADLNAALVSLEMEVERLGIEKLVAGIVECESGGRHDGVWGDGGRSYGVAQFMRPTFNELKEKAGLPGLKWKSRDDQLTLLRWAVVNGYGRRWTCFSETPLTRALSHEGRGSQKKALKHNVAHMRRG